jgi:beta-xylosidase
VHADDGAGPWSEPVRIPSAYGIDPDLAWDDDGTCLMSWTGPELDGLPAGIRQAPIDPLTGEVLGETRWLWAGTGGKFPEGPHLYRIGEWWYLLIAEGGTERGHAVTIARSDSPSGPFEGNPRNPLITHRGTDEPVQNTGHADLVQRPDGSWAVVYHGVRVRGSSPEWHVLGRETFADEVVWEDGWPVLTGHLEPAVPAVEAVRETLEGGALPSSWVGASRFPSEFVTSEDGALRVAADAEPVFVGRRQEHLHARVRAQVAVEGTGGIAVRIDPAHAVELEVTGHVVSAVWVVGEVRHVLGERPVDGEAVLELRMEPAPGGGWDPRGPDRIVAGVVEDGTFVELGAVDGRYLSTEVAGGMTGRMLGVVCREGAVVVSTFEYVGADDPAAVA